MRGRTVCGAAVLAAAAFAVFAAAGREGRKEPSYLLRYADNQPADYPTVLAAQYFAKLVQERTDGDVVIYVYSDEELGEEGDVIRQVQFGGIDMARVSTAQLVVHEPRMGVLTLPYLYRDSEHMWEVLDGPIGESFLGAVGDSGLLALSWFDAGERNFYTREQVKTLEDMRGLRLRVQEAAIMEDMVRALGAVPEAVPYSMVYSRLSTGQVDGAENNWPSYQASRHYQAAKYVLLDGHVRIPELQIMSEKTAAELPEEYMEMIRECAGEAGIYERRLWDARVREASGAAEKEGCVVTELSESEREKFRQACLPLYEMYAGEYMELVEEIRETNVP